MKTQYILLVFLIVIVFLTGCTSTALYSWGDYENQVYIYFNRGFSDTQIHVMERNRINIEANNNKIPPGFYAHLGLLYAEQGDLENAMLCFEKEKALFPESAVFMDYFLSRYGK